MTADVRRVQRWVTRLWRTTTLLFVAWTITIGSLLWLSLQFASRQAEELARLEAVASFNKDLVYRRWAAGHGGVYVPVTDLTPPNPYLNNVAERDIITPSGRQLTLVNPAYMTRQVHELGLEQFGARAHITSTNPLRPENAPDLWEQKALHEFASGAEEVTSVEMLGGERHFRLMRPLLTDESCLKCHAAQGYQVGEVRGGLSVAVPMEPYDTIERAHTVPLALGHGVLWIIGVVGLCLGAWHHSDRLRERGLAESSLRRSEERMHLALHGGDLGTWDYHVPNGICTYNERWAAMLGYHSSEVASSRRAWESMVHPDDLPRVLDVLSAHLDGTTEFYETEHRLKHKSGSWIWVLTKGRVIERDPSGKPVRVCGTHMDITDRKRAQTVLEERLALLTVLLESMQHGVLVEGTHGRILFANREFCELFGFSSPEELQELDSAAVVREAAHRFGVPETFVRGIETCRANRDVVTHEMLEMADGRILQRRYAPILQNEHLLGHVWLYRDKTDQIRLERDYRTLFREMLNGFAVHEIICDGDGNPIDYRFLDINPAFERITGLGRDIIGKRLLEVMPTSEARWIQTYGRVALTGEPATFDQYSAEISKHFVVTAFRPAPKQFACIFMDVTERKREERVRAALLRLSEFSVRHNVPELLQRFLDEAEALTGSTCGFYHFFEADADMVSLQAWSSNTQAMCTVDVENTHYAISEAGVWVDCVRERRPVIYNDYANLAHRKGMPEGHAPVIRTLTVPVIRGDAVVAILGVGNKPTDYVDEDVATIERLADLAWEMVVRRQAEEALRKNEAKIRSVFQASPIGIGLVSERVILDVNDRFCEIVGYSREAILGKSARILYASDEEFEYVGKAKYSQIQAKGTGTVMTQFRRKDGTIIDVQLSSTPMNAGDLAAGVSFTVLDLTDQKRVEKDRERLMSAIEQAAEAVVITDTAGTIEYVNPAFVQTTGYTRDETIGRNPRLLKSGIHPTSFYLAMWNTLAEGRTWTGRLTNRRKDGSLFTEDAIISPVRDSAGRIVNYVAVKRDVTEEIRLEEQYRQSQKMEVVGRLAGGVAHDFNNMLNVILGHAELSKMLLEKDHPIYDNLVEIDKAAHRSADLTRQLLAFARRQTVLPQVLDLNDMVAGMLKLLRRLIGENIDLTWHPGPDLWAVWVDPSQIDQILGNLCVNARDAIPGVGVVSIETANQHLDQAFVVEHPAYRVGDYVRLTVTDNGQGMDDETRTHAFEPFFTTKGIGKGTGLGLATVYGIVKQNDGFIEIDSEQGRGTMITIYLPRHRGSAATNAAEAETGPALGRHETILMVEDQPSLLSLTKTMLERLGYHVLAASTPSEAVSLAENFCGTLDLLITDVVMPEMNGRELAARLQNAQPGLRCLFMSGYPADAIAVHGVLEEGVSFLAKPFTTAKLAAAIQAALQT